ncbi:hypothetical protein ABB37_05986 [Leptomonas pyrrhocoris]|uniref:Uncharacterized protein n=1 Tax=Leptomonas pyrrhocoris TaxID=157538 RepID=A0A0N0DUI5_LEPPY|nr:hypothetical protein ABB37_05986 [Leptomonas pyrrhocoris]KPA78922.1 hypothetical protein ABB37_05986 [Leptomonas pyrrhocoris]|eukprot:XP_015657361.1 hypothetical protein ABB37_05986 [Leptomonas pyrrhocoris]
MPSSHAAGVATSGITVQPRDVIAVRTSLGANTCLIGVVASTPNVQLHDGTAAVLVQPRPLILVPSQPSPHPQNKKAKTVKLTGQLVDRTDPAAAQLITTPIPSRNPSKVEVGAASDEEAHNIMTAEELQEMREQRRGLQADRDTSAARVKEIDEILRQWETNNSHPAPPPPPQVSPSQPVTTPPSPTPTAPKSAEDAVKAAEATERELLLSRAGLRTVKPVAWSDLQRRTRRTSAASLVGLIETCVMLLHDPQGTQFDEAVQLGPALGKCLATVKPKDVTDDDRTEARKFLQAWPTVEAVEKEHKTAAALYRWLTATLKTSQALRDVQAAQNQLTASPASEGVATAPSPSTSPDPTARNADALTPEAESALRKERTDQLEYMQMAEEEIAALDALIAEGNALALQQSASLPAALEKTTSFHDDLQSSQTIVPALTVPLSWFVCVFAPSDAPDMEACAAKPRGTAVAFSLPASHQLVAVVRAATTPAAPATTTTTAASTGGRRSSGPGAQRPSGSEASREVPRDADRNSGHNGVPRTTASSRHSSGIVVSPRPSAPRGPSPAVHDAAAPAASHLSNSFNGEQAGPVSREAELEEKVRRLEGRLAAALQQNPKEAEVQLLRDEVAAKRADLQRVTEERDRLLLERRERSMWGSYGSAARRKAVGGAADVNEDSGSVREASPLRQPGSGRYSRQKSSPREMVDRSIVEELEEQLTAAHQRISELQIEASQSRARPSGSVEVSNTAESAPPPLTPLLAGREASEASLKAVAAPPPARTVAKELYDALEARLQSVSAELETQRQGTRQLEEQLNSALHRRTEAEAKVDAQKRELEEVWEKLEAAEARAEEQSLLTEQHFLMSQAQQSISSQPQQQQQQQQQPQAPAQPQTVAASSGSTTGGSHSSLPQGAPGAPPGLPRPQVPSTSNSGQSEAFHGFVVPSSGDPETKSQQNDDVVTVATGTANGNGSRLSFDAPQRSTSAEVLPIFNAGLRVSSDSVLPGGPTVVGPRLLCSLDQWSSSVQLSCGTRSTGCGRRWSDTNLVSSGFRWICRHFARSRRRSTSGDAMRAWRGCRC